MKFDFILISRMVLFLHVIFIVLGISIHHMLDGNGSANFEKYKQSLIVLKPILDQITIRSPIIWLEQYPTIDIFGPDNSHIEVFSEKIKHYNLATVKILRSVPCWKIRIWLHMILYNIFICSRVTFSDKLIRNHEVKFLTNDQTIVRKIPEIHFHNFSCDFIF